MQVETLRLVGGPTYRFAAGWGSLAMINAGLAESKGRSPINWAVLSFIGGPIATFWLVFLSSDLKRCVHCGK